jgi:hypothetical protein
MLPAFLSWSPYRLTPCCCCCYCCLVLLPGAWCLVPQEVATSRLARETELRQQQQDTHSARLKEVARR